MNDASPHTDPPRPPRTGQEAPPSRENPPSREVRTGREVRLASYPAGEPTPADFTLVEAPVPPLAEGQVLVRNRWFSVDPYQRNLMSPDVTFAPPLRPGDTLAGDAVGEVIAARAAVPVGATVAHRQGWREYAVVDASDVEVLDLDVAPPPAYLGALGMTGLTAYAALTRTVPIRGGEVVFVSAAAGAVGSVAGQLARILGAGRVVGSAGGPAKARRLVTDLGFDAAVDHRAGRLAEQLAAAAPDGIDIYLDNVGGELLAVALDALRPYGRVAVIGAISVYNAVSPVPGPPNLFQVIPKQLTLRGFSVSDHYDLYPQLRAKVAGWLAAGRLRAEQTTYEGIEQAVPAFLGMLRGANLGKTLVHLP